MKQFLTFSFLIHTFLVAAALFFDSSLTKSISLSPTFASHSWKGELQSAPQKSGLQKDARANLKKGTTHSKHLKAEKQVPPQPTFLSAYLQGLVQLIYEKQTYPKTALQQHIEGKVEVHFKLNQSGAISEIRLGSIQAHPLLNEAALEALKSVGNYQPLPSEVSQRYLNLVLPIEFEIKNKRHSI